MCLFHFEKWKVRGVEKKSLWILLWKSPCCCQNTKKRMCKLWNRVWLKLCKTVGAVRRYLAENTLFGFPQDIPQLVENVVECPFNVVNKCNVERCRRRCIQCILLKKCGMPVSEKFA